jgi:hypothetical protein
MSRAVAASRLTLIVGLPPRPSDPLRRRTAGVERLAWVTSKPCGALRSLRRSSSSVSRRCHIKSAVNTVTTPADTRERARMYFPWPRRTFAAAANTHEYPRIYAEPPLKRAASPYQRPAFSPRHPSDAPETPRGVWRSRWGQQWAFWARAGHPRRSTRLRVPAALTRGEIPPRFKIDGTSGSPATSAVAVAVQASSGIAAPTRPQVGKVAKWSSLPSRSDESVATLWTHLGSATGERRDIARISHEAGSLVAENALSWANERDRGWVATSGCVPWQVTTSRRVKP